LAVFGSCLAIFHYHLNRDFEAFLKKDLPESNDARQIIQKISMLDLMFPYFKQETLDVVGKSFILWISISKHQEHNNNNNNNNKTINENNMYCIGIFIIKISLFAQYLDGSGCMNGSGCWFY
jgi:hypothetical protein